jgi:hypothetical protein
MYRTLPFLVFALLAVAEPALAQSVRPEDTKCSCRAPGRRALLGDTLCLDTAEGPRLAMCVMNQNVTSWQISNEGCLVSALSRPPRS